MPEFSSFAIAVIKLLSTFGCMLLMLRMRVALWKTIFTGCALVELLPMVHILYGIAWAGVLFAIGASL